MCEKIIHEVDGMEIKVTELNEIIITNNLVPDNFHLVISRTWSDPNTPKHNFCIEFDPEYWVKLKQPGELEILKDD